MTKNLLIKMDYVLLASLYQDKEDTLKLLTLLTCSQAYKQNKIAKWKNHK